MKTVENWKIFKNIDGTGIPFFIFMGFLFTLMLINDLFFYNLNGANIILKVTAISALIIGILGMGLYTYIGVKKKKKNDM